MRSHQIRLYIIGILSLVALVAEVILLYAGLDAQALVVGGILTILLPAVIDAGAVERRRRAPGVKAIEDDVDVKEG